MDPSKNPMYAMIYGGMGYQASGNSVPPQNSNTQASLASNMTPGSSTTGNNRNQQMSYVPVLYSGNGVVPVANMQNMYYTTSLNGITPSGTQGGANGASGQSGNSSLNNNSGGVNWNAALGGQLNSQTVSQLASMGAQPIQISNDGRLYHAMVSGGDNFSSYQAQQGTSNKSRENNKPNNRDRDHDRLSKQSDGPMIDPLTGRMIDRTENTTHNPRSNHGDHYGGNSHGNHRNDRHHHGGHSDHNNRHRDRDHGSHGGDRHYRRRDGGNDVRRESREREKNRYRNRDWNDRHSNRPDNDSDDHNRKNRNNHSLRRDEYESYYKPNNNDYRNDGDRHRDYSSKNRYSDRDRDHNRDKNRERRRSEHVLPFVQINKPMDHIEGNALPKDRPVQYSCIESNVARRSAIIDLVKYKIAKYFGQEDKPEEEEAKQQEDEGTVATGLGLSDEEDLYHLTFKKRYYNDFEICKDCFKEGHSDKNCPERYRSVCWMCLGSHTKDECVNIACFRCNGSGHKNSNCPMKEAVSFPVCPKCKKRSHLERDCSMLSLSFGKAASDSSNVLCFICGIRGHSAGSHSQPEREERMINELNADLGSKPQELYEEEPLPWQDDKLSDEADDSMPALYEPKESNNRENSEGLQIITSKDD